jgi:excinuclease UvrABC nuclease subunit
MKIEQLNPLPVVKVQFKLSSFKQVPKETGCYLLTTFENEILYIGLSVNLFERFQQHLNNPEKTNSTKNGKAIWFYFSLYDSKNLPQLERTWINQFTAIHGQLPLLNKINSPVS